MFVYLLAVSFGSCKRIHNACRETVKFHFCFVDQQRGHGLRSTSEGCINVGPSERNAG
jgi:hypothetical protein